MTVCLADEGARRGRTLCSCIAAVALFVCAFAALHAAEDPQDYASGARALQEGDFVRAWEILAPLAQAGDARAENDLGVMYGLGLGVAQSYAKAAVWITRAAEHGNPYAQSTLGYMYYRARGVERDYAAAALWSRRAAEQGVASAQSNLGMLYDKGQGVRQDYAQAARWYRRAAEQGFPEGQRNLGSMYEHGHGVPANALLAYAWYGLASAAGDEPALKLMQRVKQRLSADDLARARALARDLQRQYGAPGQRVD